MNEYGETSIPGIYCAGDVAGIEEASSAMIQGRSVASHVLYSAGYISEADFNEKYSGCQNALSALRQGMFAPQFKGKNDWTVTDEGYPISRSLLDRGFMTWDELKNFPAVNYKKSGVHPVIECTQNIPCNPCQEACKFGCIKVGENITRIPAIDEGKECKGCGMCDAFCSGQAIFLINEDYETGYATVGIPYEFLPLPKKGDKGIALSRSGAKVCEAEVVSVVTSSVMDKTSVLTMKVPVQYVNEARFFKPE